MSVIHLYRIPQVLTLTTGTGAPLMNYPVNRTDFTVSRHVDNEIEFWIKNIDRKAVPLTDVTLTIHIHEPRSRNIIMTRDLTVIDVAKGLVRLTISAAESLTFPKVALEYSVTISRDFGEGNISTTMLYTDRDRTGRGVIGVVDGPIPTPFEPISLSLSDFLLRSGKQYSGAQPGAVSVLNISGQHSVAVDFSNFTGLFEVQGSTEEQASTDDAGWFDVLSNSYTNTNGLTHIGFEGNLVWVRFVVANTQGTINSITYRN